MLLAITWFRRLANDRAPATWSTTSIFTVGMAVVGSWLVECLNHWRGSLHHQLGVQRAGGFQCLEDGHHIARAGVQPGQRLYQVSNRTAGLRHERGAALLL